jgi:hypothetical protein
MRRDGRRVEGAQIDAGKLAKDLTPPLGADHGGTYMAHDHVIYEATLYKAYPSISSRRPKSFIKNFQSTWSTWQVSKFLT